MQDKLPEQTDVLIAGAGPAGLMAAVLLARQGIRPCIIDKKKQAAAYSGALFIQARTLEMLDQLGLAKPMLQEGQIVQDICLLNHGKPIFQTNISQMGDGLSKFPFILMLKQSETEKILLNQLKRHGIDIYRNYALSHFNSSESHINAKIVAGGKNMFTTNCRYLIGADGVKSTVRNLLNIRVRGHQHQHPLFIFDGDANFKYKNHTDNQDFKHHSLYFAMKGGYIAGFFPLPGNKWRIDGIISEKDRKTDISFHHIRENFGKVLKLEGSLGNPDWFSPFKTQVLLAGQFQSGNCFLIGDAAHVHTPIGAQGMNTGMQDAYNLAWKLALVLKGKMPHDFLKSYEKERSPVAKGLIRNTDRLFFLIIKQNKAYKAFRHWIMPVFFRLLNRFAQSTSLKTRFFKAISGISIAYHSHKKSKKQFKPGMRLPFIFCEHPVKGTCSLHDLVEGDVYVLIKLNGSRDELMKEQKIDALITKDILKVETVGLPATYTVFKTIKALLVRPDLYVEAVF